MTTPRHRTARPRSRRSAKTAGTRFERAIADHLAAMLDDRIDRRVRTGARDRGDLTGVRAPGGGRVVVEVKNCARVNLAEWAAEAELERGNDDALAGIVIHKRHGVPDPGLQWVTCTVDELIAILAGDRDHTTPSGPQEAA